MANNNNLLIAGLVVLGIAIIAGLYWTNMRKQEANTPANADDAYTVNDNDADDVTSPTITEEAIMSATPTEAETLWTRIMDNNDLTTAIAALRASDLQETLSGDDKYTIFAPTNDAFAKLPKATFDNLMKPENKQKLADVINYHLVKGEFDKLTDGQTLTTVEGKTLKITKKGNDWYVNDTVKILKTDVDTPDGAVYTIDTVLMPK